MAAETGPASLRSHAISGGKWSAFSAIVNIATQILQLIILGRLLGPADFGVMAMMMVVIGFAISIADFGFGNYLIHVDLISLPMFYKLVFSSLGLSIILSVGIYFFSPAIAYFSGIPDLIGYLPWFGPVVIVTTFAQMATAVLQRQFLFSNIAVTDICASIAALAVSSLIAVMGGGVWALVFGQLANSCLRALISGIYAAPHIALFPRKDGNTFRAASRFGVFQIGERLFNFASVSLDKVIIGKFLGEQALGVYSVAFQLVLRPLFVINPIFNRVALPIFSKIKNDNQRLVRSYLELLKMIGLLIFPIYLIMCLCAPIVVEVLLGDKWGEASPILAILSMLGILYALGNPIGSLVLSKGRPDWALYLNIFSVGLNTLAAYIGSQIGLDWVAILLVIVSWIFLFPLEFYLRFKLIGMRPIDYFLALRFHFIAALIPLGIFWIIQFYGLIPKNPIMLIFFGFFSAIFFWAFLFLTDKELIKRTMAMIGLKKF